MENLDFTHPAAPATPAYDAGAARAFFASHGEQLHAAAGEVIFSEESKSSRLFRQRDRMYLLLDGVVELSVKSRPIGKVAPGEVFGELASITHGARSATATAKTRCRLGALDDRQFLQALRDKPEFALALMSVMVDRLRATLDHLNGRASLGDDSGERAGGGLEKRLLNALLDELGEGARIRYPQGKVIVEEGHAGVLMYVVLAGSVQIRIGASIVERVGPGGMFGEMALVGATQRLASAVAETECVLLPLNRNMFVELVKTRPEFGAAVLAAVGERARRMAARRT